MSRSPVAARRRLGAVLRELRAAADLKIEDAARELECSGSKVSRLENGKGVPRQRDVRDLIKLYGATSRTTELMKLVDESLSDGVGLITNYRDVFDGDLVSDEVARFVALEQDSSAITSFEPDLIPGLLQTEAYVDALVRLFNADQSDEQVDRFVKFRLARQDIIRHADPKEGMKLDIVLGEQALHRKIGGADVMREQLKSLAAELSNGLSHVGFQIAPTDLVMPGVLGGPFTILRFADPKDQDVVYLEGRESATYLETDAQVELYGATFAGLASESLSRAESIEMVEVAANAM